MIGTQESRSDQQPTRGGQGFCTLSKVDEGPSGRSP